MARGDGPPAYRRLYSTGSVAARVAATASTWSGRRLARSGAISSKWTFGSARRHPWSCAPTRPRWPVGDGSIPARPSASPPRSSTAAPIAWLTEPAVAAAGASHEVAAEVQLACGSRLAWYDAVRLGRAGEAPGSWRSRLSVRCSGTPRIVSDLCLGSLFPTWRSPAVLGGAHCLQSLVLIDPEARPCEAGTERLGSAWGGSLPLAHGGTQLIALGDDFAECGRLLERLRARAGGDWVPGIPGSS